MKPALFRRELVVPGASRRDDFTLDPKRCALLIIDIQKYLCPCVENNDAKSESESSVPAIHPEGGSSGPTRTTPEVAQNSKLQYYSDHYHERIQSAVFNIALLAQSFREIRDADHRILSPHLPDARRTQPTGCEVIFTYLQAATKDRRDISLDYKISGPILANIPTIVSASSWEDLFLSSCAPSLNGKGDICIAKTSCNVFASTNLDYLLRQLSIDQLVIVGQMTEQCVESAVRHAADLGYYVCVPKDACITTSTSAHERGVLGMKGFARIVESTEQIIQELTQATTTTTTTAAI